MWWCLHTIRMENRTRDVLVHVYTHIRLCISFAEAQLLTVRPSKGGGSFETGGGHLNLDSDDRGVC